MKNWIWILAVLMGCSSFTGTSSNPGGNNTFAAPNKGQLGVKDATLEECPAGGKVYSVYVDTNSNNIQDSSETSVSTQIVCNGQNGSNGSNGTDGQNGFSTVFALQRISTGVSACESGSGLQLNSGLDLDRNNALDGSEISQTQIVCDGKNGDVGAAGPPGSNGHGVVFQVSPAPVEVCSSGGSVIVMALDIFDLGVYSPADPGQQSLAVCNGHDGSNGHDGADAPPSAYTPLEVIMPCGNSVAYKEVLLRLYNGQVLAAFSENVSGLNTRLSFLPDGTFMNTDGSNCVFSLATSEGTRSISWAGQVQNTWPMSP